jgi:hypothetical protein
MIGAFKLTRKPRDPRLWKSCGRTVENLWMSRQEKKDPDVLPTDPTTEAREWPLSRRASLVSAAHFSKISLPIVTVHRYEEQIAGRTYLIEVSPVTATRWRAQIARRPGMPTSLMPFYGQTPDEAARELSKWLSLVSTPATAKT